MNLLNVIISCSRLQLRVNVDGNFLVVRRIRVSLGTESSF